MRCCGAAVKNWCCDAAVSFLHILDGSISQRINASAAVDPERGLRSEVKAKAM
jgi:hypothetical protein